MASKKARSPLALSHCGWEESRDQMGRHKHRVTLKESGHSVFRSKSWVLITEVLFLSLWWSYFWFVSKYRQICCIKTARIQKFDVSWMFRLDWLPGVTVYTVLSLLLTTFKDWIGGKTLFWLIVVTFQPFPARMNNRSEDSIILEVNDKFL